LLFVVIASTLTASKGGQAPSAVRPGPQLVFAAMLGVIQCFICPTEGRVGLVGGSYRMDADADGDAGVCAGCVDQAVGGRRS